MPGTSPRATGTIRWPGSGRASRAGWSRASCAPVLCGGASAGPVRCCLRGAYLPIPPGSSLCSASTGASAMSCCAWRSPWPSRPSAGRQIPPVACWNGQPSRSLPASRPAGSCQRSAGSLLWLLAAAWRCCSMGPRGCRLVRSSWVCRCCGRLLGPILAPITACSACGWPWRPAQQVGAGPRCLSRRWPSGNRYGCGRRRPRAGLSDIRPCLPWARGCCYWAAGR